jgi:diguanylate cyclase (GGDEF)-like protein
VKLLFSFLLPGAILGAAALAVNAPQFFPSSFAAFLHFLPGVVLTAGVGLALLFRRGRAVLAFAALVIVYEVLQRFGPDAAASGAARFACDATALLLPLNLAAIAVSRERSVLSAHGFWWLAAIVAQPALVALLWLTYHPGLATALEHVWRPRLAGGLHVSQPAQLAFVVGLAVTAVAWLWRRAAAENALVWALLAGFLACENAAAPTASSAYLSAGALVLLVAVIEGAFSLAYRDPLTGLPTRRALDDALARMHGTYAVAMADIDHFKAINDRHGHDVGDQVLRMVASRLAAAPRARAFRYGGEEFALLFAGTARAEALTVLESLRREVAEARFTLRGEDRPKKKPKQPQRPVQAAVQIAVTISIGAAEGGGRGARPEAALRAADQALYRAKRAGRNRVVG